MKIYRKKVSERLLLIALIIILFIFVTLLILINVIKTNWMIDVINMTNNDVVNETKKIDDEILSMYAIEGSMMYDIKLNTLMYSTDSISLYEESLILNHMESLIKQMKLENEKIENIVIYLKPLRKVIGENGSSIRDMDDEAFRELLEINKNRNIGLTYYKEKIFLIRYQRDMDADSLVKIEFNTDNMKYDLGSNLKYEGSKYFFWVPEQELELSNEEDQDLIDKVKVWCMENETNNQKILKYKSKDYILVKGFISNTRGYYVHIIPEHLITKHFEIITRSILYLLGTIAVLLIFWIAAIKKLINKPMNAMLNAFNEVEKENFTVRIIDKRNDEFSYIYNGFNRMVLHIEELIEKQYNQRLLLQKMEIKQLQAQINPHFLYNAFFMLQRVIKSGDDLTAQEIAINLGIYFRYITDNSRDFVLLHEEYEHAAIYCDIQRRRFQHRIRVELGKLPEGNIQIKVPKLFLQPFIENAFKYGMEDKIADGLVRIQFEMEDKERIVIVVEDNGENLSDETIIKLNERIEAPTNSVSAERVSAIINIGRRIRFMYENDSSVSIVRSGLGGMKVVIRISDKEELLDEKITYSR